MLRSSTSNPCFKRCRSSGVPEWGGALSLRVFCCLSLSIAVRNCSKVYAILVDRNKTTKQAEADHSYNACLQHVISHYKGICSMLCNVITCVVRKQLKRHGSPVISLQQTITHIWSGFSELSVLWSTWYIMDWIKHTNTSVVSYTTSSKKLQIQQASHRHVTLSHSCKI